MPLAFILPGPLLQPEQRASDADRDTAVDILCAAVAEGRLTLAELDERAGRALSARTTCELAALIADLPGSWTLVLASASARVPPPASPGWANRAPERWSLLQSLAGRPALPGQLVPVSRARRQGAAARRHARYAPQHPDCTPVLACSAWAPTARPCRQPLSFSGSVITYCRSRSTGEGACYLQISGPVRPVIVNGHRGRVAGVRTPACEAGRITG
jgi:hypothetical protein